MEELQKIEKKTRAWAVTSLTTGIIGLLLFMMPYFGLPLSIFAVVANAYQEKNSQNGMGTAGKILGIVGIVINSLILFFIIIMLIFTAAYPNF